MWVMIGSSQWRDVSNKVTSDYDSDIEGLVLKLSGELSQVCLVCMLD